MVSEVTKFLSNRGVSLTFFREAEELPVEFLEKLYDEHKHKDFFSGHMDYMKSGPCLVSTAYLDTTAENEDPTVRLGEIVRSKTGPSVRNTFGRSVRENVLHCSDTAEARVSEIELAKSYGLI